MTTTELELHTAAAPANRQSLVARFAARFGVDAAKLLPALKDTAFRQKARSNEIPVAITDAQMMALLIVADQYGLNPWTKEIYAFPQEGGIVPIVGLDGWARIVNDHPNFNGISFEDVGETRDRTAKTKYGPETTRLCPDGIKCRIHRKDRDHPIEVTEWYEECFRPTDPWVSMPRRQLRHKAMIQCARVAFSFAGIYDADEGQDIIEGQIVRVDSDDRADRSSAVNDLLRPEGAPKVAERVDDETETPAHGSAADPAPATAEEPAQAPQNAAIEGSGEVVDDAEDENSTQHLLQCVMDAETADDLDFVRSKNAERDATKAAKKVVDNAIANRSKAIESGE